MASKILVDIKKEISRLESQIKTLVEAANMIAEVQTGRGRKTKISSQVESIVKNASKKTGKRGTGKRGRPKGSKNGPDAKKTGPKGPEKKVVKKTTTGKRGRPKKTASNTSGASN
jgi:hypothetical protein